MSSPNTSSGTLNMWTMRSVWQKTNPEKHHCFQQWRHQLRLLAICETPGNKPIKVNVQRIALFEYLEHKSLSRLSQLTSDKMAKEDSTKMERVGQHHSLKTI